MKKKKSLLLKFEFYYEMPQWVIPSDVGAYTPGSRTIHIAMKTNRSFKMLVNTIVHELIHHVIEVVDGQPKTHHKFDKIVTILEERG